MLNKNITDDNISWVLWFIPAINFFFAISFFPDKFSLWPHIPRLFIIYSNGNSFNDSSPGNCLKVVNSFCLNFQIERSDSWSNLLIFQFDKCFRCMLIFPDVNTFLVNIMRLLAQRYSQLSSSTLFSYRLYSVVFEIACLQKEEFSSSFHKELAGNYNRTLLFDYKIRALYRVSSLCTDRILDWSRESIRPPTLTRRPYSNVTTPLMDSSLLCTQSSARFMVGGVNHSPLNSSPRSLSTKSHFESPQFKSSSKSYNKTDKKVDQEASQNHISLRDLMKRKLFSKLFRVLTLKGRPFISYLNRNNTEIFGTWILSRPLPSL